MLLVVGRREETPTWTKLAPKASDVVLATELTVEHITTHPFIYVAIDTMELPYEKHVLSVLRLAVVLGDKELFGRVVIVAQSRQVLRSSLGRWWRVANEHPSFLVLDVPENVERTHESRESIKQLTLRYGNCLLLIAKGVTYPKIGRRLVLSESTVKLKMAKLARLWNVRVNRCILVTEALRRGVIK